MDGVDVNMESEEKSSRSSYKEVAMRFKGKAHIGRDDDVDHGAISDDDVKEKSRYPSWFGIGMTREEKWRVRKPWWNSLIVKLVGIYRLPLSVAKNTSNVED